MVVITPYFLHRKPSSSSTTTTKAPTVQLKPGTPDIFYPPTPEEILKPKPKPFVAGGGGGGFTRKPAGGGMPGGGSYIDPNTGQGIEESPTGEITVIVPEGPKTPKHGGGGAGGGGGGASGYEKGFENAAEQYKTAIEDLNKKYSLGQIQYGGYKKKAEALYNRYLSKFRDYEQLVQGYEQEVQAREAARAGITYYEQPKSAYYDPATDQFFSGNVGNSQPVKILGTIKGGGYVIESQTGLLTPQQQAIRNIIEKTPASSIIFGGGKVIPGEAIPTTFIVGTGAKPKPTFEQLTQLPTSSYDIALTSKAKPYIPKPTKYDAVLNAEGTAYVPRQRTSTEKLFSDIEQTELYKTITSYDKPAEARANIFVTGVGVGAGAALLSYAPVSLIADLGIVQAAKIYGARAATAVVGAGTRLVSASPYALPKVLLSKEITMAQTELLETRIPGEGILPQIGRGTVYGLTAPITGTAYGAELAKGLATSPVETLVGLGSFAKQRPYELGSAILVGGLVSYTKPIAQRTFKDFRSAKKFKISYRKYKISQDYIKLSSEDFIKKYGISETLDYDLIRTEIISKAQQVTAAEVYSAALRKATKGKSPFTLVKDVDVNVNVEAIRQAKLKKVLKAFPEKPRAIAETINKFIEAQNKLNMDALQKGYYAKLKLEELQAKNPIKYANAEEVWIIKQAQETIKKPKFIEYQDIEGIPGSIKREKGIGYSAEEIRNIAQIINQEQQLKKFVKFREDFTYFGQEKKLLPTGEIKIPAEMKLTPEQYLDYLSGKRLVDVIKSEKTAKRLGVRGEFVEHTKGEFKGLKCILVNPTIKNLDRTIAQEITHFKQPKILGALYPKSLKSKLGRLRYYTHPSEVLARLSGRIRPITDYKITGTKTVNVRELLPFSKRALTYQEENILFDVRKRQTAGEGLVNLKTGEILYEAFTESEVRKGLSGNIFVTPKATTLNRAFAKQLRSRRLILGYGQDNQLAFVPFKTGRYRTTEGYVQFIIEELQKDSHGTSMEAQRVKYVLDTGEIGESIVSKQVVKDLFAPIKKQSFTKEFFQKELVDKKITPAILEIPEKGLVEYGQRSDVTTLTKIGETGIPAEAKSFGTNFLQAQESRIGAYFKRSDISELRKPAKYSKDSLMPIRESLKEIYGRDVNIKVLSSENIKQAAQINVGTLEKPQLVSLKELTATTATPVSLFQKKVPVPRQIPQPAIATTFTGTAATFGVLGMATPTMLAAPTRSTLSNPMINPLINPTINPTINPQINPQINPLINPQINPLINPQINPLINPQINPLINPQINPQINPLINPSINPNLQITFNDLSLRGTFREKKKKRKLMQVPTYSVQLKRRGKFVPVSTGLTKTKAIQFGSERALQELARTFKVTPTGKTKEIFGIDESYLPQMPKFREYKIRSGQKVLTPNQYIQRTEYNLQSLSEKAEIKEAKRIRSLLQ